MKPVRTLLVRGIPVVMLALAAYTAGAQKPPLPSIPPSPVPGRNYASAQQRGQEPLPPPSNEQMRIAQSFSQTFAQVASQVGPSVVRIVTRQRAGAGGDDGDEGTTRRRGPREAPNPFEGTPFERFFEGRPRRPERRIGMGSGVVIDGRGYILTNNHVVENAEQVKVSFVDGHEVDGRVVGTDPKSDLAVVKVEGVNVQPARLGDSDRLRPGEYVMAIGNPFGLDHSVTVGVLSAKGRAGFESGQYEDFLQTDASINPGNSGGPLVNLDGEVVGINTMIVGIGTGVGFAVPSSMAKPIADQLIQHGRVIRPYIGVVMQSLSPELQRSLGKGAPARGALIAEVQPGSPAARAGLQPGDVVVSVDGREMKDSHDVQIAILGKQVGAEVKLGLWRDGKTEQRAIRTVPLPAAAQGKRGGAGDEEGGGGGEPGQAKLGITLQTLTPDLARRLGLEGPARGAVVAAVREGSGAAEAGLRPGDVLVEIDRKPVATAEQAARALTEKRAGGHLVRARRGDAAIYLVLPSA